MVPLVGVDHHVKERENILVGHTLISIDELLEHIEGSAQLFFCNIFLQRYTANKSLHDETPQTNSFRSDPFSMSSSCNFFVNCGFKADEVNESPLFPAPEANARIKPTEGFETRS